MSNGLIYMASPFSHPDPLVRHQRYVDACKAAGRLMKERGLCIFAPIPHSYVIEEHFDDHKMEDHLFWLRQDFAVLAHCTKLLVLTLDGWEQSKGVKAEMEFARERGIPIEFVAP